MHCTDDTTYEGSRKRVALAECRYCRTLQLVDGLGVQERAHILTLSALQVSSCSPDASDPNLGFVYMKVNATFLKSSPLLQAGNPGPYHCDLHADQDPSWAEL